MTPARPNESRARLTVWATAFLLYLVTLYPSWGGRFEWGDAAKWQYMGSILGLPHPPGSPLYVLLTYVWSLLPLPFEMAVRMNLFSAVAGSLAVLTVFMLGRRLGLSLFGAGAGAAALAISLPLWVFSTEAEVYSLAALFNAFILDRAAAWRLERKERDFWLGCGAWLLGFQDHLTLTLLGPALFLLLLATEPRMMISGRWWLRFAGVLALSLLPLVWVWFRAPSAPYSEMESPRSWTTFWQYVFAKQYGGSLFAFSWQGLLFERPGWAITKIGTWVGYGVLFLVPVGLGALGRRSGVLAAFIALAFLGPFAFYVGYRIGDELGFCIPILPALVVTFGAASDHLAHGVASLPARRVTMAGLLLVLAPSTVGNLIEIRQTNHLTVFDRENDGDRSFRWDLPCLVSQAQEGATIIPPWGDYGTRQVVYYHQFAEPRSRAKRLTYKYMEAPGYYWAPARWRPNPEEAPVVWTVKRGQAAELQRFGYQVETVDIGPEQCGPGTRPFRAYKGTAFSTPSP